MTQYSYPWDGVDIGDAAALAPYSSTQWNQMLGDIAESYGQWGVLIRSTTRLDCSLSGGTDTPVIIQPGAAMVMGQYYVSTSIEEIPIPRPITNTRYDRIVLQRVWATKTTRLARIAGIEGAGVPPALTQVYMNTWELPLAVVIVPTAGAMSIYHDRIYRSFPDVTERQGGSATDWDVQGTTWYEVKATKIVVGHSRWSGVATNFGEVTVTYNNAFGMAPIVLLSQRGATGIPMPVVFSLVESLVGSFTWRWDSIDPLDTYVVQETHWMAIGQE